MKNYHTCWHIRPASLAFILVAMTAIASVLLFAGITVDDALIVSRYARKFALGKPLFFNEGETINALTSVLHGHIMAAFALIGLPPVITWKIAGAVLLAATAWLVGRYSSEAGLGPTGYMLVLMAPPVVFWAFAGLETPLLAFFATLTAYLFLKRTGEPLIIPLCMLMFLTRYDSVMFTLPIAIFMVYAGPRRLSHAISATMCFVTVSAVLAGLWIAYGSFLPTSFFLKGPSLTIVEASRNAIYMVSHLLVVFTPIAVALALVRPKISECDRRFVVLAISLGLVFLYGLTAATKHMMFNLRLLTPYLAPGFLFLLVPIRALSPRLRSRFHRLFFGLIAVWAVFILLNSVKIYYDSIEGIVAINEGKYLGIRDYRSMITRIESQADAIRKHSEQHQPGKKGVFVLSTRLGGALPNSLLDFYILEDLVSYRSCRSCFPGPAHMAANADYIHMMIPTHGSMEDQLKGVAEYQIVSEVELCLGGKQVWSVVAFNPNPEPFQMTQRSFDPCSCPTP